MKKSILTFLSILTLLFFIGCTNASQEKSTALNSDSTNPKSSVESDSQKKYNRSNYAVIWKWATNDSNLVDNNLVQISTELTDLWKKDIIENAYFDNESKIDKLTNFANIAFFLKAKNDAEAKTILDGLTVVTKDIATYKLHPVGQLWLERKTDVIHKKGISTSYATVWTTLKSPLQGGDADKLLKKQSDTIIELWNEGVIENVYFDIEGSYSANDVTDFVFFVNANSETEAKNICESLPFFKENIASYQVHQAGIFWMGKYQNN